MTSISAFQLFSVLAFCVGSPIGEIQRVTGLDFLPKMSATKRAALENFKAPALWPKE